MDAAIRQLALDPSQSFIVEAPAGSGKTEILVQRFLSLLAKSVSFPEEILAITFTRKAAHEMRSRIINALEKAKLNDVSSMQSTTVELAKKVLLKDQKENWQLLENPNRLRIQTIDALCMFLTQQMPIISGLGGQSAMAQYPQDLYRKAVEAVLATLDEQTPWQDALINVFNHFDNQQALIETIFIDMLKKRDQWLPYIIGIENQQHLKQQFEIHLQRIQQQAIAIVAQCFPKQIWSELLPIAEYAGFDFSNGLNANLATLLLTQEGSYRKQVDKRLGFPADAKNNHKKNMHEILQQLQDNEDLRIALINLREAPPLSYCENSWQFLQALITLLPIMAAQLWLVFQQHKQIDFIEVSTRALNALGFDDNPTDLALVLDYQLHHILVDEFQDTSITQFRLLEKLTYSWQQDDGHTLFLVGDPMQSIYRFREANVGLFLKAKFQGIGHVKLKPLQLSRNFRSHPKLIDWLNQVMPKIMPHKANISLGAIPFTACQATKVDDEKGALTCVYAEDSQTEAQLLAQHIRNIKQQHPDWQIAILVRARSHLIEILPVLKNSQIAYHALEIESLAKQPVIQDLLALIFALLDFDNKLAWLSILRSPFCGLDLNSIEIIANTNTQNIWSALNDTETINKLTSDSAARINKLIAAISPTLNARDRMPLARWIESAWIATGAAFYTDEKDHKHIDAIYQLLTTLADEYQDIDAHRINEKLSSLFTDEFSSDNNPVQVMTIHKAKGLEFDAVLLPGLTRRPAINTPPLLRYMEQSLDTGTYWLLAPIQAKTAHQDPIYQYLGRLEKHQDVYETQRLLYVALTRAKYQLALFAVVNPEDERIASQSLFALLAPHFPLSDIQRSNERIICHDKIDIKLQRIPLSWQLPQPWYAWFDTQHNAEILDNTVDLAEFAPENIMRKHVGTLLHRILKYMAETGVRTYDTIRSRIQLIELGVSYNQLDPALSILNQAITGILTDERGQWILHQHQDAVCEYALHTHFNQKYTRMVIDRMFIDNNERWIIDYKTGQDSDDYTAQLQAYAQVMKHIDPRPIRLALYFPLTRTWKEFCT